MAFNIQKARQAGYSDQEIQDYLKSSTQKAPWLNDALQLGGALAGGAVGAPLGAAAGAAIPGVDLTGIPEAVGAYGGGIVGAGVGAGAGNAGADIIRQLMGDKTVRPEATIPNSIQAGKIGAAGEAIGLPVAKGLGIVAHPIASIMGRVDNILAKSAKEINIGDANGLLQEFRDTVLPQFRQQGKGPEAGPAFDNLSARVNDMIDALRPHVNADAGMGKVDVNKMTVPVAQANKIKRNIYGLVKDMGGVFGEMGNTETQVNKVFASKVADAVHAAEPATKTLDSVAHAAYQVPDALSTLSALFPTTAGAKAVRTIGGLPFELIQKAIPQNGGALRKILPFLIQSGGIGLNGQ